MNLPLLSSSQDYFDGDDDDDAPSNPLPHPQRGDAGVAFIGPPAPPGPGSPGGLGPTLSLGVPGAGHTPPQGPAGGAGPGPGQGGGSPKLQGQTLKIPPLLGGGPHSPPRAGAAIGGLIALGAGPRPAGGSVGQSSSSPSSPPHGPIVVSAHGGPIAPPGRLPLRLVDYGDDEVRALSRRPGQGGASRYFPCVFAI